MPILTPNYPIVQNNDVLRKLEISDYNFCLYVEPFYKHIYLLYMIIVTSAYFQPLWLILYIFGVESDNEYFQTLKVLHNKNEV